MADPDETAYKVQLGERLCSARLRAQYTQEQFAFLIGISRSSVANFEAGRQGLRPYQILYFAELLKVDPHWLFLGDVPRTGRRS